MANRPLEIVVRCSDISLLQMILTSGSHWSHTTEDTDLTHAKVKRSPGMGDFAWYGMSFFVLTDENFVSQMFFGKELQLDSFLPHSVSTSSFQIPHALF